MLVAISIPIFSSQLEKDREATDAANLRAAYAEVSTAALTGAKADEVPGVTVAGAEGSKTYTVSVDCAQKQKDWQNLSITDIGGVAIDEVAATKLSGWNVVYSETDSKVTFTEK